MMIFVTNATCRTYCNVNRSSLLRVRRTVSARIERFVGCCIVDISVRKLAAVPRINYTRYLSACTIGFRPIAFVRFTTNSVRVCLTTYPTSLVALAVA